MVHWTPPPTFVGLKTFSISIVTRNPSILKQLLISVTSEINLPLFSNKSVFEISCEEINVHKTAFNLLEIALEKFFESTFNYEIDL